MLSIPDIYQRWQTFHTIPSAVKAWRSIPFCPTLLTHPTSNAPADVQRRAAVRARVLDFNAVLAQVCAQYPQCTTDGGAAFRAPVTAAEFSSHDYWHPNITGQAALAKPHLGHPRLLTANVTRHPSAPRRAQDPQPPARRLVGSSLTPTP